MSRKAARAVLERLKTDDAFRVRVLAIKEVKARVELLNAEGFQCTAEELKEAASELTDEALD